MAGMGWVGLFFLILLFAISIAILRWALRINDIINRLDGVISRLESIINALKAGLKIEETK